MSAIVLQKRRGIGNKRDKNRLVFYCTMFAIPLLQFAIFYLYVNFNSLIMSFQSFTPNPDGVGYITSFVGFDNFKVAAKALFSPESWDRLKYSLIFFACNLFLVTPLSLFFAFYIAKKFPLAGFFRVMLYLPCVLSAVVLVLIYRTLQDDVYRFLFHTAEPLINKSEFGVILFYNLWLAYGMNTMLYTGAMTDINPSLIEASKLDGAGHLRQFIHIYVPMIWPTLVTFIVTGMTGLFIEQMQLYLFYEGGHGLVETFGYYFYTQTIDKTSIYETAIFPNLTYPQLAALGILVTVIIIPAVLVTRKLLQKYGPSTK